MLGELVQTTAGTWITHLPTRCPNGHTLGPNQVLVGHVVCLGHDEGGHTSWRCRACDAVVYGPPMNKHCTVVRDAHGPALAQQQLSHSKLATTEAHYLQRHTRGPDVRDALDKFAAGQSGGGKYQESISYGRVGGTGESRSC